MIQVESPSVLVVDDTRVNRIILENKLKEHGYEVTSAENGREALNLLFPDAEEGKDRENAPSPFDAVILDIMMPEIDGIEVLKELRKVHTSIDLPVIMATAKDQSEDVVEALQAGANDYVTKPIDIPVLLARLETHLSLKQSHDSLQEMQRSLIHVAKMETIGHLAAGVAHEIRNPLAQMQMAADGIANLSAIKDNESATTLSGLMNDAIQRADVIIRRLMEFSESAQLTLQEGDLNSLIEETLKILDCEFEESRISRNLELSEETPRVLMAAEELQQTLLNIILNSLQAMEGNEGELSIVTGQRVLEGLPKSEGSRTGNRPRNGDSVGFIEISDTGPGIPEDILDSVFDAFFTTKPTGSGTGVGLTVARKMIDLHEGLIEIVNREDRPGVRVTILLKMKDSMITTV